MRRPFRPGRPLRRALMGTPAVPPALQHASRLMAAGDYPAAAEAFETLARGAEARMGPRAPQLYLQAGRARVLAGQIEPGMAALKRGLGLMAAARRFPELHRAGNRVINELRARGLTAQADEIAAWLKQTLPDLPAADLAPAAPARAVLPTHCPSCGGPLRPDEAEWLDQVTAECPFCGSPVRAE